VPAAPWLKIRSVAKVGKLVECSNGATGVPSRVDPSRHVAKVRLDSWKSIAEYLRRSPRTVQRWHAEFGLPIHRFGGAKGPVFTYSDELDAWLSGSAAEPGEEKGAIDELVASKKRRSIELCAQGDALWELRSEDNLSTIAGLYRGAIDRDPRNASAFIGLANSLIIASLVGILRGSAAYPRAIEALQRAVRLGFDAAETRCTAAWLQMIHERKWKSAREGFEDALGRPRRSSFALCGRALLHVVEGSLQGALQCLEEAWRHNALATVSNAFLCWVQYLAGDYDQALETVAHSRASGDNSVLTAEIEALVLMQTGPVSSMLIRIESLAGGNPQSGVLQGALGYAYAISDQPAQAQKILRSLKKPKSAPSYPLALVLMGLGERHQTASCLKASFAEGSLWSLGLRLDPIFQPLRGDVRFESLLRKLTPMG
jgi:tetratricopeptide (TPR) repeat protein